MATFTFETADEHQTRELGRQIGERVQPGTVIGLNGTLGTGKTRLSQGIGLGMGIPSDTITSPTYTICVPYSGRLQLLHLDTYRIEDETEVDELGLDEWVDDGAVLVIEWADRMASVLPPLDLRIQLRHLSDHSRSVEIESLSEHVDWLAEIVGPQKA